MHPSDLEHLVVPGDPQLHPDGLRVVYVLTEVDVDDDRYHRTIQLWDGQHHRRFTHGPSDTSPRWSPDGRWLAFLRKERSDDAQRQVVVMPADGGEAERRTDLPLGVSDLDWAPDSEQLVVVGTEWTAGLADLDDHERRRRPRRVTRLPFRSDPDGWLCDRRSHLWLVDVHGAADARCLTPGDRDQHLPAWRPDGTAIAFLSDPEGDGYELEPHTQAFEVDVASGRVVPLVAPGAWEWVGYGPDGRVFLAGLADPFAWPGISRIYARDFAGADAAGGDALGVVDVTGHLDRDVLPASPPVTTAGPRFVDGGFLTAVEDRGITRVVHVRLDGWEPGRPPETRDVVGGRRCVTGFAARRDGSAIAFTATDPATPGELIWREDGRERCVTDLARRFRAEVDIRPTERFTFVRDGTDLDAWAVLPDGFDDAPDHSVPVLLNIHGGPTAQYGEQFLDEFQVGAGAGFLVVGSNPRGSSGRGTDWARAVVGVWTDTGSIDTLDLEAAVAATLERYPQADPERVGVMGGSYGGFAAARLLAWTDRFRSAIVERGLLQWESFGGTSDIGPHFDRMFLGASLFDAADRHHGASPTSLAADITTPTLVLHSESDWRCPIEQGEQFLVALKRAGVTAEMVRFPDEGHELSRAGSPQHRVQRFDIVVEWHTRFLCDRDDAPAM